MFLEMLPPMRDIQYLGMFILHGFEDSFLQKESARDRCLKFFEFIPPALSTWAQCVLQGIPNLISNHTLEDLLHGSESMNYGSLICVCVCVYVCVCGWILEEHQPITFPQVEIAQDYVVHRSLY